MNYLVPVNLWFARHRPWTETLILRLWTLRIRSQSCGLRARHFWFGKRFHCLLQYECKLMLVVLFFNKQWQWWEYSNVDTDFPFVDCSNNKKKDVSTYTGWAHMSVWCSIWTSIARLTSSNVMRTYSSWNVRDEHSDKMHHSAFSSSYLQQISNRYKQSH